MVELVVVGGGDGVVGVVGVVGGGGVTYQHGQFQ